VDARFRQEILRFVGRLSALPRRRALGVSPDGAKPALRLL
jgi:hypothetical protein